MIRYRLKTFGKNSTMMDFLFYNMRKCTIYFEPLSDAKFGHLVNVMYDSMVPFSTVRALYPLFTYIQ
jgi:hypothetical protein